jgi:Cu/Zn superoxide dismutase
MMIERWTTIFALVTGLALAIGGGSLAAAQNQSVTVNLTSQNNSGIVGTATFTELGAGKMRVAIQVTGAGTGPQPAHIHDGTCANLNPAPKFALASLTNGTSTTEIDGSIQQVMSAPHAVHLHKSPDELPIYVACADIRGTGPSAGQPATLPSAGEAAPAGQEPLLLGLALIVLAGGLLMRRARRA